MFVFLANYFYGNKSRRTKWPGQVLGIGDKKTAFRFMLNV